MAAALCTAVQAAAAASVLIPPRTPSPTDSATDDAAIAGIVVVCSLCCLCIGWRAGHRLQREGARICAKCCGGAPVDASESDEDDSDSGDDDAPTDPFALSASASVHPAPRLGAAPPPADGEQQALSPGLLGKKGSIGSSMRYDDKLRAVNPVTGIRRRTTRKWLRRVAARSERLRAKGKMKAGCWDECVARLRGVRSPYEIVTDKIKAQFGGSVLPYYSTTAWCAVVCLVCAAIWIAFAVVPWSAHRDTTWKDVGCNLAGVPCNRVTDGSFWFYSGYPPELGSGDRAYNMAAVYTYLCIATFGLGWVLCVGEMARRARMVSESQGFVAEKLKLNTIVFSWDWAIRSAQVADQLLDSTWLALRATAAELQEAKRRVSTGWRILGITAVVTVAAAAATVLYFTLEYKETMDADFPYTSAIVVASVNACVPFAQSYAVRWIDIKNPRRHIQVETLAIFLTRMMQVFFIFVRVERLEEMHSGGGRTMTLTRAEAPSDPSDTTCAQFHIGLYLGQLVLVDFVCGWLGAISAGVGVTCILKWPPFEFSVATRVLAVLYRQCLIWVALPYAPAVLFYGCAGHACDFFILRWVMFRFHATPRRPVSDQGSQVFFQVLVLCALIISIVPFVIYFLMQRVVCGPHAGGFPFDPITDSLGVEEVDRGPLSPAVWVSATIAFASAVYVLYAALRAGHEREERQRRSAKVEDRTWRRRARRALRALRNTEEQLEAARLGGGAAAAAGAMVGVSSSSALPRPGAVPPLGQSASAAAQPPSPPAPEQQPDS